MNSIRTLLCPLSLSLLLVPLQAEEESVPKASDDAALEESVEAGEETPDEDPALAGLREAAHAFVVAYNERDAKTLASLFTEDGEISDLEGENVTVGRAEIEARYEELFADEMAPSIAIEVDSVRFVAPGLVIEDGTAHFTPADDEEAPPSSYRYTAVLTEQDDGWKVAATRTLADVSGAAARLADLASVMCGEWTSFLDEARLDLAFGWDPTGHFLVADTLITGPDAEPQAGSIWIGWDAARHSIVSWILDAQGGMSEATWTPTDEGWIVHSAGSTADGEQTSAVQSLSVIDEDEFVWSVSHRVVAGETQPDRDLRIVRQTPAPSTN